MPSESKNDRYGSVAICLHWASAVLILFMVPLGFLMQQACEDSRFVWYRLHFVVGLVVLLLTLLRLAWKFFDGKPAPAPGLTGLHLRGMELVHILLYLFVLSLAISGLVLNIQCGMLDVLLRSSARESPEFSGFGARRAHGMLARIYIALLVSHIGGVVIHHIRFGGTLQRMLVAKTNHD